MVVSALSWMFLTVVHCKQFPPVANGLLGSRKLFSISINWVMPFQFDNSTFWFQILYRFRKLLVLFCKCLNRFSKFTQVSSLARTRPQLSRRSMALDLRAIRKRPPQRKRRSKRVVSHQHQACTFRNDQRFRSDSLWELTCFQAR